MTAAFDKTALDPDTEKNAEQNTLDSVPNDMSKIEVSAPSTVTAEDAARIAQERKLRNRRRLLSSSPLLMFGVLVVLFAFFTFAHPDTFPSFANIKEHVLNP